MRRRLHKAHKFLKARRLPGGIRRRVGFFAGLAFVWGGVIRCAGRPREWSCGAVPPQERWHEGVSFPGYVPPQERTARGGLVFVFSLGIAPVSGEILSHPLERSFGAVTPLERRDPALRRGRRGLMRFLFFWFCGGAVAVCSEGGCGSMCWPVDRPATHAAAGAAARGVRGGLGDSFTPAGAAARGGGVVWFWFGDNFGARQYFARLCYNSPRE